MLIQVLILVTLRDRVLFRKFVKGGQNVKDFEGRHTRFIVAHIGKQIPRGVNDHTPHPVFSPGFCNRGAHKVTK